ncbi:MAG: DUF523 domain-containing protein [Candidatus Omnitrophica bacterium]|nr:DUF523 domain-containing protein [Candidatus Omnitrophota bacterium]
MFTKPNIFISRCLNSARCRWNGEIISDKFVEKLKPYVNFITTCPECEIGLGTPRNPIRIVFEGNSYRLTQLNTGKDITKLMNAFVRKYIKSIKDIDGFILKDRSPSCGIKSVKVYAGLDAMRPIKRTLGFFAKGILENFPDIVIETEARLASPTVRRRFIEKVFIHAAHRNLVKKQQK